MNSNPKCLVAVPTFKRPQFLPRILACFKRLNYDNKKLIIINDDPMCRYTIDDDPEIDIINIDRHLQLSVKRNLFLSWDFDIMFPLDDDDLFLPNRLMNHVLEYQKDSKLDLYRNLHSLMVDNGKIFKCGGGSFTNSSFTRKGIFQCGGYSGFHKSNQDDISLMNNMEVCIKKIDDDPHKTDFIYQWDGICHHNTHNTDVIMSVDRLKDMQKFNTVCDVKLHIDYDVYDTINSIANEAISNNTPIEVITENHGSIIKKVGVEYAFIHIPKNSGTSMRKAIENIPKIRYYNHAARFEEYEHLKSIVILREPIDRFTSAFFYVKKHYVRDLFDTPEELIQSILFSSEDVDKFLNFNKGHTVNGVKINTDWVFHPQSGWIDNPYKILIYDNLDLEISKLNAETGLNIKLRRINTTKRIDFQYSKSSIEYLKDRYSDDFKLYRDTLLSRGINYSY